jgi:hypothetical protein
MNVGPVPTRSLPGDDRQAEHALIELERPLGITNGERDMVHLAGDQRRLAGGRLRRRAHLSVNSGSTAVVAGLKLYGDAVRVAEIDLGRSLLRTARVLAAHPHARAQRPAGKAAGRALSRRQHAEAFERLHDLVDLEPLDGQAHVVDPWRARRSLAQRDELRARAKAQNRDWPLGGHDREAEQPLVELQRSLGVGDRQRDMVHREGRERAGRLLSGEYGPEAEHAGQGAEDIPATDWSGHGADIMIDPASKHRLFAARQGSSGPRQEHR